MTATFDRFSGELQARLAGVIAGVGLVWAARVSTSSPLGMRGMILKPGLIELLCVTILFWLVAKLRTARSRTSGD